MSTIIWADVHERLEKLLWADKEVFSTADRVVLLGDFWDTFAAYDEGRVRAICAWIVKNINNPKFTFILANHDSHYAFKHPHYKCSGYNPRTQVIVDEMIHPGVWRNFKIFDKIGPYTVSHAGFCEATLQYAKTEVCREAIEAGIRGDFDPIFAAGRGRGGYLPHGGPLWLDWNAEFDHIDDFPQIVGHTPDSFIRFKGAGPSFQSWCIDTHNQHYILLDEETGKMDIKGTQHG